MELEQASLDPIYGIAERPSAVGAGGSDYRRVWP